MEPEAAGTRQSRVDRSQSALRQASRAKVTLLCALALIVNGCGSSEGDGNGRSTAAPARPTVEAKASLTCGEVDGPAVDATVSSSERVSVIGSVVWNGQTLGTSDRVVIARAPTTRIYAELTVPNEAFGVTATFEVKAAATGDVIAETPLVLRNPPGVSCG
jgi:hypothetical protein